MTTWVEEFHDFAGNNNNNNKFGSITTGGGMKSTFVPRKPSRKETLEAELKLLEWHKLANDAALKAALMQTKQLRDPSPKRDPSLDEDAKRIRKIITNEQTKPLEVSKDFVLKYQQKEVADSEKLANQVEKHIQTLRDIRGKLEERIELKSRINEYRDWKKGFHEKKMAIMSGQTLHNFTESHSLNSKQIGGTTSVNGPNGTGPSGSAGGSRDLAVVLDSLNKLSQLEARITTLERDNENMYEKLKKNEETSQLEAERTALEFKKKRAVDPLQKGAMKTVYALKTKKVPISKGVKINKGTFLTAVERDTNNLRDARYREKQRQLALATSGQKNLRERVRVKKTRQLENINSHRKHEEALQELSKRRTEQNQRMKEKRTNVIQGIGASSGRKFKNKYLEDFQKIKNEHRNKREKSYSTRGGDKEYLSSMTAPSSSIVPKRPPPTTKTAGTVTRRVNTIPIKNRERDHSQERESSLKMPPIVGSGVGGVRALKEMKKGGK